jgi:hypothetical protein
VGFDFKTGWVSLEQIWTTLGKSQSKISQNISHNETRFNEIPWDKGGFNSWVFHALERRRNDFASVPSSGCLTHPQGTTQPPPPAERPTESAIEADARPQSPRPGAAERGAGRERRERNFRPLPQPMDGSKTAIVQAFQGGTDVEREQRQDFFTKKSLACSTPPGTCFPSLMTTR